MQPLQSMLIYSFNLLPEFAPVLNLEKTGWNFTGFKYICLGIIDITNPGWMFSSQLAYHSAQLVQQNAQPVQQNAQLVRQNAQFKRLEEHLEG